MQPPTEADVIAATESLKRQKTALDGQIIALDKMACQLEQSRLGEDDGGPGGQPVIPWTCSVEMDLLIAEFLRAYHNQRFEDAQALDSAIAHNERALQAYRSGIILPTHIQRKPNN